MPPHALKVAPGSWSAQPARVLRGFSFYALAPFCLFWHVIRPTAYFAAGGASSVLWRKGVWLYASLNWRAAALFAELALVSVRQGVVP
jgi:hypothetical protein